MKFPFISGEAQEGYLPVNMFLSTQELDGENALRARPGQKKFIDAGLYAQVRALYGLENSGYALIGNTFYRIYENKTYETLGTIDSASGFAWIEGNGTQIQVVAGESAYIYESGTLTKLGHDKMSFKPGSLCYEGGYFLYSALGTKNFYESEVNDGSDVNEVDYAIVTGEPSEIITVIANNGEVWAFCEKSFEVYYNSGGATFGFSKSFQGCMNEGLCGAKAALSANSSLFWISDKGTVLASQQYSPSKISTPLIDKEIGRSSTLTDVTSFSIQIGGHTFIVFNIPSIDKTFVYDASTQLWFQWGSSEDSNMWSPNCHARIWGKNLVGDYQNGIIYELDFDTYSDDGTLFNWQRTMSVDTNTSERTFWNKLVLDFETGTGISTGQGSDPQVMLQLSKDRGKTWGGERWKSLGKIGEYKKRVYWNGLGSSHSLAVRVSITDPVKRVCTGAYFE